MGPRELVYLIARKLIISAFSFRHKSSTEQFLTSPHTKALGQACCPAGVQQMGRSIHTGKQPSAPGSCSSFQERWEQGCPGQQESLALLEVQRSALPGDGDPLGVGLAGDGSRSCCCWAGAVPEPPLQSHCSRATTPEPPPTLRHQNPHFTARTSPGN